MPPADRLVPVCSSVSKACPDGTQAVRDFNLVAESRETTVLVLLIRRRHHDGRMKSLIESGELIVMEDCEHPHAEDQIPAVAVELGFGSAISIPLSSSSGVLGMLTVVYRSGLPWSHEDRAFLLDVGRVLGVLVQRVQMSKKDVELRMLRDRKQISSEIHDNVSQSGVSWRRSTPSSVPCFPALVAEETCRYNCDKGFVRE